MTQRERASDEMGSATRVYRMSENRWGPYADL
jgi:hypothetical protein